MTPVRIALCCSLLAAAACGNVAPSSQLPWLVGVQVLALSDSPTEAAAHDAIALGASDEAAYGALEVRGDLAGDGEPERVLASYGLGIVVLDAAGHSIARVKPLAREGSADGVVALAIVERSLLAVAVQAGGHRESEITLSLYRLGDHGLQLLVALPVEEHDGDATRIGGIVMLPGTLLYRAPGAAAATTWRYDARHLRYLELPVQPAPLH
ncbi:MAG: hypothetical protein ABI467_11780 [Kofleriaceae bacterium]